MTLEIDAEVIKATTRCEKRFACLAGDLEHLCQVEECVADVAYFVRCLNLVDCSYRETFGDSNVCTCPTRHEIYRRYKR